MTDTPAPATMTQADYARHRKVSAPRIAALIAEGRIPVDEHRRVLVAGAEAALGPMPFDETSNAPPDLNSAEQQTTLAKAQARKMEADAALSEIRTLQMAGKLVDREEVELAVATLFGGLKEKLLSMPVRIAGKVRSLSTEREVAAAIAEAIEDDLARFAKSLRDKFATGASEDGSDASEEDSGQRVPGGDDGGGASADPAAAPEPERVG
ncbi:MAG: hypothetical protein AB7I36_08315 [Rhodospirillaceae bacterium]